MQDFRKKLNVAAALRQQHQHQQQHHGQNMAVFSHQPPVRPHHLINNWNLLNPTGFASRPGHHLPPPLMHHNTHAISQMPRNPALFNGSLMAPRFQAPQLHNNLPSQQFNASASSSPFDFYNNKILMN